MNKNSLKNGAGRSCIITRKACFSSSHRYWLPELSEEDNCAQFGSCTIEPGHGHNYELIVSMEGDLNKDGMVLNLSDVKHSIKDKVTSQLDFRFLNDISASGSYVPAKYDGKQLIPGKVEFAK